MNTEHEVYTRHEVNTGHEVTLDMKRALYTRHEVHAKREVFLKCLPIILTGSGVVTRETSVSSSVL